MSPSASSGTKARVIATLEGHGATKSAAAAVWLLGQRLRVATLLLKRELAAMVDLQTGAWLGRIVTGTKDRVDISPQLAALGAGQRSISVHTHPGSSSFSPHDVALVVVHPAVRIAAVVGVDGYWYVLSTAPGTIKPSPAAIHAAYTAQLRVLTPKYHAAVQSAALSRSAAWLDLTHEIWQRAASPLGLRYDRVEGRRRR